MKKVVIVLVVILIIAFGGWWLFGRGHKANKSSLEPAGDRSKKVDNPSQAVGFDALANTNDSFEATVSNTTNGKTTSADMEYDKESGNVRYATDKSIIIYTKSAYYLCQDTKTCFKYDLNGENKTGFDPTNYQYSAGKLASLKGSASDEGLRNCPAGSCRVWKVTSGNFSSLVYVDVKTKRISQVTGVTADGSYQVTYDYKNVSVKVPAKVQSLPTISPQ